MYYLILVHVLSAVVGVGPTFFAHVLVRRNQSPAEYRTSQAVAQRLEIFPKVGGTLAVLTGLALYFIGNYGSITQLWLLGSFLLYGLIQAVVIGRVKPLSNRLTEWLASAEGMAATAFPAPQQALVNQVNIAYWLASAMGLSIFVLMVLGSRAVI